MPLDPSEIPSEVDIKKSIVFDELIERRHGTSINPPKPMKEEFDTKKLTVTLNMNLQKNSSMAS
jgi:hypothetical protein